MMANHENRAYGPPPPREEHDPASRLSTITQQTSRGLIPQAARRQRETSRHAWPGNHRPGWRGRAAGRAANGLHRLACALTDTTQNHAQNDRGARSQPTQTGPPPDLESMSTYL